MFNYARPDSLTELCALLNDYGPDARLLAGGTDLLVRIKSGRVQPRLVIDLKRVTDLSAEVSDLGDALQVGARVRLADLAACTAVSGRLPALAEAAGSVGSVQIRNRATLAGNLCNASPAADTAPALLIYGARVHVVGVRGRRLLSLADFLRGPGKTALERGELVEAVSIPYPPARSGSAYVRLTRRRGVDLATVSVACLVAQSGSVRFAFGAVGPVPILATDESGALADPRLGSAERKAMIARLAANASPITDVRASREYRQAMLQVLCERALAVAHSRLDNREC